MLTSVKGVTFKWYGVGEVDVANNWLVSYRMKEALEVLFECLSDAQGFIAFDELHDLVCNDRLADLGGRDVFSCLAKLIVNSQRVQGILAVPGRASPAWPGHPSPGSRRLSPSPTEDVPTGTPPATRHSLDHPVGSPSARNPTSPLRRPRRSPQGGRDHFRPDNSCRDLIPRQAHHGVTVLQIQDVSDVPSPVSGSADAQRSVPHAGVVGHDGAPSLDDGFPLSQEALRHSF